MDLKDLRGRLTVVLTPELRQLALDQLHSGGHELEPDLLEWFREKETPDGTVLDATYSEAEATMIDVLLQAILGMHDAPVAEPDLDEHIRILARH